MRPLTLTMTAFGPFPDSESIRFLDLGENPLFLINGPTGSGKTTILDAICFALYGKTTGDEREGTQMRCDLAAADTLTEVTLEFEFSGRRFSIRRLPEQQRPKARGEGTTTQAPEAQLVELLEGGKENLIVSSKVSEATREIEELTGLSVDQFRQVMVLPQGKFRQLLMADSHEREKIFSQLFQTRIYKRLEESLKTRSAEIRRARDELKNVRKGILEGAELESAEELERELTDRETEIEQAKRLKEDQEQFFTTIDQALLQARTLQQDFTRLENVTAEREKWQQQKEEIETDRLRVQRAERAGRLQPIFAERNRCEQELTDAQNKTAEAKARLRTAEETLAKAKETLSDSQRLQTELDAAKQQAAQLDGYRARAEKLAATRQSWQQAATDAERAELLLQYKLLTDRRSLRLDLEQLERTIRKQQELLQTQTAQGGKLRQRYEDLERTAKELELAWHQGQAAILATELQSGEPCPVCGSCEHPAPAHSAAPLPTQQQVEQARQDVREANEGLNRAREKFAEEQHRLRELQQQQERCRVELGAEVERPSGDIDRTLSELRTKAKQLALPLPDPHQLQAMNPEQLRAATEEKKSKTATAQAQAETAEQELPEKYRESGALAQAMKQAQQRIDTLDRQIQLAATAHQQALTNEAAAQTAAQAAEQQRQKAEATRQKTLAACQSALAASPFIDEQEYLAALLDEQPLDALKTRIVEFDSSGQRLAGAQQQLQEQLRGKERPDLAQLETQRNNAETEKNQAVESWRQLDKRLSLLLATQKKLQKAAAQQAELDRRYAVIGTLSDVANGQTGNKISLQRFVLSVLLDDVLIEASHRLSLMSKGRYQLLRKEDRAKGNKASGLELEVEDAYTGKVRPVATLSGGESFMAALAMALGLSDVVQAYAGGIRLDTLFIDEGFGSLDAESLDLAIRTLIDLQASGRMIGIISHVAELKEQMPLRLDVIAGRDGSRVRLVRP